jgi:hypothetical protein
MFGFDNGNLPAGFVFAEDGAVEYAPELDIREALAAILAARELQEVSA